MKLSLVPVLAGGGEALPLVGDSRGRERLGGDDEDQLAGPVETRLELPDPGAAARQIGFVEEDLPRPARGGKAGLEAAVEDLHPGLIAVGIAQKRRVVLGHVQE